MESFEHVTRVIADPRVQLTMPHIDRDDVRSAALQQTVREAAGRRPGVECTAPGNVDAERGQSMLSLATTDIPRRRSLDDDRLGGGDEPGRLDSIEADLR